MTPFDPRHAHDLGLRTLSSAQKRVYLNYLEYLDIVAKRTGRVIFGQLWDKGLPDGIAAIDFVLMAFYADAIAETLSQENPLLAFMRKERA